MKRLLLILSLILVSGTAFARGGGGHGGGHGFGHSSSHSSHTSKTHISEHESEHVVVRPIVRRPIVIVIPRPVFIHPMSWYFSEGKKEKECKNGTEDNCWSGK